jgi:serine protease Do
VRFQPLTTDLAKSFGLESDKGALIANVEKDTPAEKAGLKAGDIILEYDGKTISDTNELPRLVAVTPIDKKVRLAIFRDGKRLEVFVVVAKLKDGESAETVGTGSESEKLGITVQELTKELAVRLGIKDSKSGLVITEVKPGSAAEEAGITTGGVIIEINGQRPETLEAFKSVVSKLTKGAVVRLLLKRPDGSVHYVAMKVD